MQHRDTEMPATSTWSIIIFHNPFSFLIVRGEEMAQQEGEEPLGKEKNLKYLFSCIHHQLH